MSDEYADLVDVRAGRVSRRVFAGQAVPILCESEPARMFGGGWLFAAYVPELPRPAARSRRHHGAIQ